jgi:hypothetical protein
MAKTQVLNTVFKGDASGLTSEIGRLTNTVSSTLSGVFARANSALNISATSGVKPQQAQALARMESTLAIPGLAEAMSQITRRHTFKQDAGIRGALRRMKIDEGGFFKMQPAEQAEKLAEKLGEISDPRQRMITASMLGARDPFLSLAKQRSLPGGMEAIVKARNAAMRHAGDQDMQERQALMGQILNQGLGEVTDTTKDVIGGKPLIKTIEMAKGTPRAFAESARSPKSTGVESDIMKWRVMHPFQTPPQLLPENIMEQPKGIQDQILHELKTLNKQMGP